ncbi:MAG TPA: hypothetical protein VJX92_23975 [Methylomirabilota bacterium]|nr:hypothetical protein [Methylomirabilota bacterium]
MANPERRPSIPVRPRDVLIQFAVALVMFAVGVLLTGCSGIAH